MPYKLFSPPSHPSVCNPLPSIDKIDAKEMQQQRPKHKIRKRPLMRNALKLALVLRIRLNAQRGREYELADGCAEAGEEGVEWLYPTNQSISSII
jgi:hypothetical protein